MQTPCVAVLSGVSLLGAVVEVSVEMVFPLLSLPAAHGVGSTWPNSDDMETWLFPSMPQTDALWVPSKLASRGDFPDRSPTDCPRGTVASLHSSEM